MVQKTDIIVLGATGFTGRQTVAYLAKHPEHGSKFTFAIAGRSKSKLAELAVLLDLPSTIPIHQVDVTKYHQVESLVKQTKVLINAVGPYWTWGTPVVKACVENGIHYVDLTGEPHWVKEVITIYDYNATKTGAIIVPSAGFDSIPSDLLAYLGRKTLNEFSPSSLAIDTSVSAFQLSGSFSGGTFATMMTALESVPRQKLRDSRTNYYLSPIKGVRSPPMRFMYSLPIPDTAKTFLGGFFFMMPTNRQVVQRSWGLFEYQANQPETAGLEAEKARYGPTFKYDEFMVTGNRFVGALLTTAIFFTMIALRFSSVRWLAKRFGPVSGEGASDEDLKKGWFVATNITTSVSTPEHPTPVQVKTVFKGHGDPGYLATPWMISESALALALDYDSLPAIGKRGGFLTPMTAMGDVLIARLRKTGYFEIDSGVVGRGNKKIV